jgi:uncharacterized membrane protein YozB (DUF420 family)
MATCRVCRGEVASDGNCQRCGSDVGTWQNVDWSIYDFFSTFQQRSTSSQRGTTVKLGVNLQAGRSSKFITNSKAGANLKAGVSLKSGSSSKPDTDPENGLLELFLSRISFFCVLLIFAAVLGFILIPGNKNGEKIFHPIFILIISCGVIAIPVVLYKLRWAWWEYKWRTEIYVRSFISPMILMVDLSGVFILTMLSAYMIFKFWGNVNTAENIIWWQKLIFGGIVTLLFVSLSSLVSLYRFDDLLTELHDRAPHPIYANMVKFRSVVFKDILKMLECLDKQGKCPFSKQLTNCGVTLSIAQMTEMQFFVNFGLVSMSGTTLARPEDIKWRKQDRQWKIITDRWGRIKTLQPKNLEYRNSAS